MLVSLIKSLNIYMNISLINDHIYIYTYIVTSNVDILNNEENIVFGDLTILLSLHNMINATFYTILLVAHGAS